MKAKVKATVATVLCGISTFAIMPATNYSQCYSKDANTMMSTAMFKTGNNLRAAFKTVGGGSEEGCKVN